MYLNLADVLKSVIKVSIDIETVVECCHSHESSNIIFCKYSTYFNLQNKITKTEKDKLSLYIQDVSKKSFYFYTTTEKAPGFKKKC